VGAATAETVTWSVAPSPNHKAVTANGLNGVSCVSTTSCTAVGSYDIRSPAGDQSQRTLIESWNGAALSIVPSPNAVGRGSNQLYGVSCVSLNSCTAVGFYFPTTNSLKTLIGPGTAPPGGCAESEHGKL
jgi:hypothetical protein